MNELKTTVDWLTYMSYEHNRKSNPHIAYWRWRKIFQDALVFEEIYDKHVNKIEEKP